MSVPLFSLPVPIPNPDARSAQCHSHRPTSTHTPQSAIAPQPERLRLLLDPSERLEVPRFVFRPSEGFVSFEGVEFVGGDRGESAERGTGCEGGGGERVVGR